MLKNIIFDWGNTLMIDFPDEKGPMYSWNKIESVANAKECLSNISGYVNCYIGTNSKDSNKDEIYLALNRVGLGQFIHDIFCFRDVGYEKPKMQFFEYILTKLNISKRDVVFIGDDFEKDYIGPITYGIHAILYDPKNRYPHVLNKISDLMEIEGFLSNSN